MFQLGVGLLEDDSLTGRACFIFVRHFNQGCNGLTIQVGGDRSKGVL